MDAIFPWNHCKRSFSIIFPLFKNMRRKPGFYPSENFCSGEFCSWYKTSGKRSPRDWFHELFLLQILSEGTHGSHQMELWSLISFVYLSIHSGKGPGHQTLLHHTCSKCSLQALAKAGCSLLWHERWCDPEERPVFASHLLSPGQIPRRRRIEEKCWQENQLNGLLILLKLLSY